VEKNNQAIQKTQKPELPSLSISMVLAIIFLGTTILFIYQYYRLAKSQYSTVPVEPREATAVDEEKKFTPIKVSSWQEFNDPAFPFSFKYPADWLIEKYGTGQVLVSNHPEKCEHCSEEERNNHYEFSIDYNDWKETEGKKHTLSVLNYLLIDWLEFLELNSQHEVPIIPGFTQWPIGYPDSSLFAASRDNISVIEVHPYYFSGSSVVTEYALIDQNYRHYTIHLGSPGYAGATSMQAGGGTGETNKPSRRDKDHPIVEIINSLKFK